MPKRRMTPRRRAQILRFQSAGVKARKKSGIPHGKMLTLFHGTSAGAAKKIVEQQYFRGRGGPLKGNKFVKSREVRRPEWGPEFPVYLTNSFIHAQNYSHGASRGYGGAVLKVQVPFRKAKVDYVNGGVRSYTVDQRNLAGRKVTVAQPRKRRKR